MRAVRGEDRVAGAAVAGTGVLLAAFLVFYLGGWGSGHTRRFVTDLVHLPLALVYVLLGLRVVLRGSRTPRARRAWLVITAAYACRLASQTAWFIEDGLLGDPPYPAVADYFFVAFVPVMFAGLLLVPTGARTRGDRIKLTLDAVIVATGTFIVLWYLLLGPLVAGRDVPLHQLFFSLALPIGDLLLVLALAMLLLRRSTATDPAVRLLAAAVTLFVVADVAYGYLQLHVGFTGGMWPDLFWTAGDFLLVLAAHRAYQRDHPVQGASGPPAGINWLPYAAIALAYGVLGYLAREQGLYPLGGMIIGAIALTGLVVARQMLVLRENRTLAVTDPLTGLANRTLINRRVARLVGQPPRPGRCAAIMVVDLDKFKPVNDAYGHEAGDAVLQAAAVALRSVVRAGDLAGRLGGDEFALVLGDLPGPAAAGRIAQRLVDALRTPVVFGDVVLAVEASVGVVLHEPGAAATADQLLHQADTAMYAAKRSGHSRYAIYTPQLDAGERDAELRSAIDNDELVLHYQPAVALTGDGAAPVVAVEALVRWNHPHRGLLPPDAFIGLAEETGAVIPLGAWVLREACRQGAAWRAGLPGADRILISVNLSPHQAARSDLVGLVTGILDETGFPAGRLILEITEGAALDPGEETTARLAALRARGIRFAVDDFGTGHAGVSCLHRLPVSILKVDRSFVAGIADDPKARRIAEAVVRLGAAFDLAVVAEGIETAAQARLLAGMGCGYGQGSFFHGPLPPRDAELVLRDLTRTR